MQTTESIQRVKPLSPPYDPELAVTLTRMMPPGQEPLKLADELHDTATVSDRVWGALAEHYGDQQLVELVAIVGQYHAVSYFANALGVGLEDAAKRFPGERRTAQSVGRADRDQAEP